MATGPKVVLIHDWLMGMRGGEKCLESACRHWPDARLFTAFHRPGSVSPAIESLKPITSSWNRLPRVDRYYRYLLPAFPLIANWKIPSCDLVLSFSHCLAKAAAIPPDVPHISYCFTPMRYAWHMRDSYFARGPLGKWKGQAIDLLLRRIREWDRQTSKGVTHFVAISKTIQNRIRECYQRESVVIYPPVDTEFYTPTYEPRDTFYLIISAFAPYKRFDLAVEACTRTNRELVVIGTGQEAARLKRLAGPTVKFLGWQSEETIRDHFRRAKALLFPAEEDFGIVPVESQACGCPVIAFGRGGATETVRPHEQKDPTGVFFEDQNVDSVIAAIDQFELHEDRFDPHAARRNALPFNKARYERELFAITENVLTGSSGGLQKAA